MVERGKLKNIHGQCSSLLTNIFRYLMRKWLRGENHVENLRIFMGGVGKSPRQQFTGERQTAPAHSTLGYFSPICISFVFHQVYCTNKKVRKHITPPPPDTPPSTLQTAPRQCLEDVREVSGALQTPLRHPQGTPD